MNSQEESTTGVYIEMSLDLIQASLFRSIQNYFDATGKDAVKMSELNSIFIGVLNGVIEFIKPNHDKKLLDDINKYLITAFQLRAERIIKMGGHINGRG